MLSYYFLIMMNLNLQSFLYLYCHVLIEVRLIFIGFFADGQSEYVTLFR